eukprot:TRINITY_DN8325_c0_g1_i1.p1 TRINITY_DN8325_c0_g1~~TRINITY_DN8325_c0_g1_i1.p1  ORF type:complete len:584 (+),score=60.77 TRINITY_DN8325_c0_g1_i1:71-1822(+)
MASVGEDDVEPQGGVPSSANRRAGDWDCPGCGDLQFGRNVVCKRCGTPNPAPVGTGAASMLQMPGDWQCPGCNDLQFARNLDCRTCRTPRPSEPNIPSSKGGAMRGDWYCPGCNDLQFAKNAECRRCQTPNPNPTNETGNSVPRLPGDWTCPTCGDFQFARNPTCRKCQTPNPEPLTQSESKPGDWYCPNCSDLQFARNVVCRKCGTPNQHPSGPVDFNPPSTRTVHTNMPGDWSCPSCGDLQFARNTHCRRCSAVKPNNIASSLAPSPRGAYSGGSLRNRSQEQPYYLKLLQHQKQIQQQQQQQQQTHFSRKYGHHSHHHQQPWRPAHQQNPQSLPPGDWECPGCGDHQFARNTQCRRCAEPKPSSVGYYGAAVAGNKNFGSAPPRPSSTPQGYEGSDRDGGCKDSFSHPVVTPGRGPQGLPGDWICGQCGDLQFARNLKCRRCQADKPTNFVSSEEWPPRGGGGGASGGGRPTTPGSGPRQNATWSGDWSCPKCADVQFARNTHCRRCGEPRSDEADGGALQGAQRGDWSCPKCGDLVFAKHATCRICQTPNPEATAGPGPYIDPGSGEGGGRDRSRSPRR